MSADGLAARRVAYAVLNEVFFRRKTLDEAFDPRSATGEAFAALDLRDRGFVKLLASVVLKRAREFDLHLATLLRDPLADLAPPQLLTVFRLGLAQIAVLQTPVHAAVDTCVELAEAEGIAHHKPLVNAVMRRAAREGYAVLPPREAGRMMLPDWLWAEWMQDYGVETALDIAAAMLDDAPVDFTLREPAKAEFWARELQADILPNGSLRKASGGFIPGLSGFEAGAWWVQNAAASLPAQLIGAKAGMTVVDLCAAPGGKTAQLAAAGATVIALDRSAPRLKRLQENMLRLKMDAVTAVAADGAVWRPQAPVDAVLLDAPCSATGTLRHQPDALWLKQPADQQKLAALQARLLQNAFDMVKAGGVVVYCTCSLQKAEGEAVVDAFLAETKNAERMPVDLPYMQELITDAGDLRVLPQHWGNLGGLDGFYIARLRKIA